jgi:hypothetical protein
VARRRLTWTPLSSPPPRAAFDLIAPPAHPLAKGVARSLAIAGIPKVEGAATALDDALGLLEVAAELEHALMVQYLYACFSCGTPSFAAPLRVIAMQEMGHLITVQNLRLLLGGAPYLGRQDQSPHPDQDPFVMRLEPLSLDALAKYVVCEAPDDAAIPTGLAAAVAEIRTRAEASVGAEIHRVGALYAALYWLFMPDDTSVGAWTDFPAAVFAAASPGWHVTAFPGAGAIGLQADSAEWEVGGYGMIVATCADRDGALTALAKIAAQGEGTASQADSHFEVFVRAYQQLEAGGVAIRPVPIDPTTATDGKGTPLVHPVACALSPVLDASYRLLLLEVQLALGLDKTGAHAPLRQSLIAAALGDMKSCIRRIADKLAQVPLVDPPAGDPRCSGAAFCAPPIAAPTPDELRGAYRGAIADLRSRLDTAEATAGLGPVVASWLKTFRAQADDKQKLADALDAT